MTAYPVLLLPLLALAMVVFLPLFNKDASLSKSQKRRRRRNILLCRWTVLVLLATIVALGKPLAGMNSLVQGVLFSLIILMPMFIINWLVNLKSGSRQQDAECILVKEYGEEPLPIERVTRPTSRSQATSTRTGATSRIPREMRKPRLAASERPAADLTEAPMGGSESARASPAANVSLHQRVAPSRSQSSGSEGTQTPTAFDQQGHSVGNDNTVESPAAVQEQLDRVAELVRSYNLGEPTFADSEEQDPWPDIRATHDTQSLHNTELIAVDVQDTDLTKMSVDKTTQWVVRLREDKARLQKLVIAQQSALESERESHDQSRLVARDAIKIMRDSRAAQKHAVKVAHRERAQRQRIELQYKKVSTALDNALSIIESKKRQQAGNQPDTEIRYSAENDRLDDILAE